MKKRAIWYYRGYLMSDSPLAISLEGTIAVIDNDPAFNLPTDLKINN